MFEYMKNVRVQAVGVGCVIDENGRKLRMIGNMPVKEGDIVWTDGHIAYGHRPVKEQVHLPAGVSGVPFADKPQTADNFAQGYYNDTANRRLKHLGNAEDGGFLVNDERRLYLEKNLGKIVLDAELLTDNSDVVTGYIMAYGKVVDISSLWGPYIYLQDSAGNPLGTLDLRNKSLVDLVAQDFASIAESQDYEYSRSNYNVQLLQFRFTDRKGHWEMYVGVDVRKLKFHHVASQAQGYPLFTNTWTMSREILSRSMLAAGTDLVICKETVTISGQQTGSEDAGSHEIWDTAYRAFAIVKWDSSGNYTIIHRNYYKPENYLSWKSTWEPSETTTTDMSTIPWPGPVNAQAPGVIDTEEDSFLSREGSYYYTVKYVVPTSEEDITGCPQIGLPGDRIGTESSTRYDAEVESETFPRIRECNNFSYDIPDGYTATISVDSSTNTYGEFGIKHNSSILLHSYPGFQGKYRTDYGLVKTNATTTLWRFPKFSCYQFPQSSKTLVSHYGERLMLCDGGNYTSQGVSALNLRLRRMRKIRKATQNQ